MFALKNLVNCSVNSARKAIIVDQLKRRLLYNSFPLFSKNFSPESSPVKVVVKKKRKIVSSSSEDDVKEPSKIIKKEPSPVSKKM